MVTETAVGRPIRRDSMGKVAAASLIGSAIEWYDFFLFGTASALVFSKIFFPTTDPLSGTLLAFATFGVGFFARPIGGIIAGHLGDRIGRKKTLIATLMLMGIATALVGLVPTYDSIGALAPALLVTLRLVQGLGVGGEWGGAALLAVEHAPAKRRGYYGSWPQLGVPAGLLLSSGAFAAIGALPKEDFLTWGWRVPFIASAVLVIVGLLIRARISEPPAFRKILESNAQLRHPIVEALRNRPKEVVLSAGIRFADNVLYYVFATFGLTYMTSRVGLPSSLALGAVLIASALELVTMPMFGALSDRVGRRPVIVGGAAVMILMAFPFFWLVDTGNALAAILACTVVLAVSHSMVFAPISAWFAEMFGAGSRYSGVSVGFQLGSLIAGAPTPFLATYLLASSGGAHWPVALMVVAAGSVTLICALIARDHSRSPEAIDM